MFRNRVDRFDDRTVYAAVLVGVVVSAAVSYRVDVSGIALWVTAFLSTLVPAGAFLAGTLLLERGR